LWQTSAEIFASVNFVGSDSIGFEMCPEGCASCGAVVDLRGRVVYGADRTLPAENFAAFAIFE
jgi:hypothetical protein